MSSWKFEGVSAGVDILVVGNGWSELGWQQNRVFDGAGGKLLDALFQQENIGKYRICKTNMYNQVHVGSGTGKLNQAYESEFDEFIESANPKVILACGTEALRKFVFTTKALEEVRGLPFWNAVYKVWVLPTLLPGAVTYNPELFYNLQQDIRKLHSVMDMQPGGDLLPQIQRYNITNVYEYYEHKSRLLHPDDGIMAVDIETEGFDFMRQQILSIGVGPAENEVYIFTEEFCSNETMRPFLQEILGRNNITYVYQNGKFDVKFMRSNPSETLFGKKYCVVDNVRCDFDTMMAHYNVDERQGTHGLKVWARELFSAPDWDAPLKQFLPRKDTPFSAIPRKILYEYQAYDIYYTRIGYFHFLKEMHKEDTYRCFKNVHMPAIETFADMELQGIPIDRERLQTMYEEGQPRIAQAAKELELAAREVGWDPVTYAKAMNEKKKRKWEKENLHLSETRRAKYPGPTEVPKAFNSNSHPQLSWVAYDLCKMPLFEGKTTCNKDAVDIYRHRHPFWKALANYKEVNDLFGTFIKGMLERVDPDGRIRPDFYLHGTQTGRISCTNPNMQNLPRSSDIKDFFVADAGCSVVNADYKTLEVVIAAILSGDETMKKPFKEGKDFHSETTMSVFGEEVVKLEEARNAKNPVPFEKILERSMMMEIRKDVHEYLDQGDFASAFSKVWDHLRFLTKFITFGIMYGRGAKSLAEGELNCPEYEATRYVNQFFNTYHVFKEWLDARFKQATTEGFVQNVFGFKRRWPFITQDMLHKIKNQSWNTPIQGSASMLCMSALCRVHAELKRREWGRPLFTVHDSIVYSIKDSHMQEALSYIHDEMTKDIIGSDVGFEVDLEIGPTYKRVQKVVKNGDLWVPKYPDDEYAKKILVLQ